jgi:rod shape-determining protein MreD
MRNLALIVLGFVLLVLQAATATLVPAHAIAPNLLLPVVIYLGVSHDVHVVRGAAISFVLGYLLDSFCGSPMGLQTFVLVATFVLSRFAGLRLFMRGPLFQVILTFVVGMVAGGTILALRAIFERPAPFPVGTAADAAVTVVGPALTTALVSPLVFIAVRRVDGIATRRRDEGAAAA